MSETPARARKSSPWFVIVVVVLVAALATEAALLLRPKGAGGGPAAGDMAKRAQALASGPNQIEVFGREGAPIKIEFYAPLALEWHQKTIGLLRTYDQQHPGVIQVTLMPMGKPECDQEMTKRGFSCAVVFVNGQHEFTLPNGKKVDLQKKPNAAESFYNSEDVITVVSQLLAARPKPWYTRRPAQVAMGLAVLVVVLLVVTAARKRRVERASA